MNLTIPLSKFIADISAASGLDKALVTKLIIETTRTATTALAHADSVDIKGIGTFRVIDDDVVFAPDPELAEAINLPFAAFEAVELPDEVSDELLDAENDRQPDKAEESAVGTAEVTPPRFFPPLPTEMTADIDKPVADTPCSEPTHAEELPDLPEAPVHNQTETEITLPPVPEQQPEEPVEEVTPPIPAVTPEPEPYKYIDNDSDEQPAESRTRNWKLLAAAFIAGVICFLAGYAIGRWLNNNPESADIEQSETIAETEISAPGEEPLPVTDSIVTQVADNTAAEPAQKPRSTDVVTDTIGRTRFLTTMARQHYGRMEFWVYIYEENADKLGNPNQLEAGTVVVIPPAEKYGIDKNDAESVAKAEAKAKEISARFSR